MDRHIQQCELRHEEERAALETSLSKQRAEFEKVLAQSEARVREVAQWGDPQACWRGIDKVIGFQKDLMEQEERMASILEQEKMIHGSAG